MARQVCIDYRNSEPPRKAIVERFSKRFEEGLTRIAEGLTKPRGSKKSGKVRERLGRLKEKCRGIGRHYRIKLILDDIRGKVREIS